MAKAKRSYKKVTTVFLEGEVKDGEHRTKMFFCPNCRTPVIQYRGHMMSVVPGMHPYEPTHIIKCKGNFKNEDGRFEECGYYYSFVSTVFTKNPRFN